MTLERMEWPGGGSYCIRLIECPFCNEDLRSDAGQALSARYQDECEAFHEAWSPDRERGRM